MPILCNREAFKFEDGCPPVEVDLEFPDFDACEEADSTRLKGVSNMGLRRAPAFPIFLPTAEQIPVDVESPNAISTLGTIAGAVAAGMDVTNPFDVDDNVLTLLIPVTGHNIVAVV